MEVFQITEYNQYVIGDNLELLKGVADNSIDLIYFDPPYNTGRNFFDFNDKLKRIQDYIDFIKLRVIESHRCLNSKIMQFFFWHKGGGERGYIQFLQQIH